jgi:hypothetical protein
MGQSSQHQADPRGVDECFARRAEPLVVLAQTATLPALAERALHHPAARQYATTTFGPERLPVDDRADRGPHATRLRRMPDHFDTPAQLHLDPGLSTPRVARTDLDVLHPWKLRVDPLQHQGDRRQLHSASVMSVR